MSKKVHQKLGQFYATAICGNDILSSSLYVSGIAIIFAGVFAPLVLLFIGFVLFLYKSVYTEVVEALPINGGAYNCLLNGTSKTIAAIAGITTFLSYIATSVLSGNVGIEYLHTILPALPIIPGTIVLLLVFALLVISGIKDSAKVAFTIFAFHVVCLVAFVALGIFYFFHGQSHFTANLHHTWPIISKQGGIFFALYLAFSASLLGVSGFESSANFVEEQQDGVFRKTLRNMLTGVAIFNPLIALVILNAMPFDAISSAKDFLLADAANILGGELFKYLIAIDAFFVLAGAVLTSFVGVSGLMFRMASDGCLPGVLAKQNSKGSYPAIIIVFFLLCSSILLITHGNLLSLAGVYTIAFLGVMSLFAFGNLILKETRGDLKRTYSAPIFVVMMAFLATFFGILGNIRIDPNNLHFFELYFVPSLLVVLGMIYQTNIMKFALKATKSIPSLHKYIQQHFEDVTDGKFLVFIHHVDRLYEILEYISRNETGTNVILVHTKSDEDTKSEYFQEMKNALPVLKKVGAFQHLNITLLYKDKPFGPELVDEVSKELKVRKNRILIGSIHETHPFDYADLGGVRIIA